MNLKGRNFLTLKDFTPEEITYLIDLSAELKAKKKAGELHEYYRGKNIALIFEKTSTRTRCSFEVAAHDLGMGSTYLDPTGSQIGKKESIADTARIPESVLQGTYDIKTLKKSLKKTGTVIDLSGCSLDSVLYEISAQRPVIAKTGADTSVVIVGYDEYNTWLYDPVKKEIYPYGMNDSTDLFQKAGNVFITYIETVNY